MSILQKSQSKFQTQPQLQIPIADSQPTWPTIPPAPCPTCGTPAYWQSRTDHLAGELRCLECEPPVVPSLVGARWMVFTPDHHITGEPTPTWVRVDKRLRPRNPVATRSTREHLAELVDGTRDGDWAYWETPTGLMVHSKQPHARGQLGQPGRDQDLGDWFDSLSPATKPLGLLGYGAK